MGCQASMNKLIRFTCFTVIAILVITNPNQQEYQSYASQQLKEFLKQDGCHKISDQVEDRLNSPCKILVDTISPQLKKIIHDNTEQKNFLIFSIYDTQFPATPFTAESSFTTLGVLDRFFLYQTKIEG